MAYASHPTSSVRASVFPQVFVVLRDRLASAREAIRIYRQKREVYLRTLRELRSYRPHELRDLRIQADDIEALAREQAGL
jgi:hypothetical protein